MPVSNHQFCAPSLGTVYSAKGFRPTPFTSSASLTPGHIAGTAHESSIGHHKVQELFPAELSTVCHNLEQSGKPSNATGKTRKPGLSPAAGAPPKSHVNCGVTCTTETRSYYLVRVGLKLTLLSQPPQVVTTSPYHQAGLCLSS